MIKKLLPFIMGCAAFVHAQQTSGCTDAPNGQYPENIYTPNCSGNREYITEYGFSGEYSSVRLTAGINYEFQGSLATDFITITTEDGQEILGAGLDKVSFEPTQNMVVRFYLHTNENCGSDYDDLKARSVKCSAVSTSYCEPILDCSGGAAILNVSTPIENYSSDCSVNGYSDNTSSLIHATVGNPFELNVLVGYGWFEQSVSVWIDFNRNFDFEEEEFFLLGSGTDTTISGNITIPNHIEIGEYRMRVRLSTVGPNLATWDKSCDVSEYYGETEDYPLVYTHMINTEDIDTNRIMLSPNPVKDDLYLSDVEKILSFTILDLTGQEILQGKAQSPLKVESLTPGVYIIQMQMKDGSMKTQKLIKK